MFSSLLNGRVIRARIILRSKAAKHSAKDEANRFPSISIVSLFRHALNMTETTCPILRTRIRNFAEYVA